MTASDATHDLVRQALRLLEAAHPGLAFYFMAPFAAYQASHAPRTLELAPAEEITLPMPRVYPERYRTLLHHRPWHQQTASVRSIEIERATVMGKSDFVFTDFFCLHPDHLDFVRDLTAEEAYHMVQIDAVNGVLGRHPTSRPALPPMPAAISLIGSTSQNYAHWLTEIAPKLALLDAHGAYADLPLIVDTELHANMLASLDCISRRPRRLIPIERGQLCQVDRLVVVTPTACVPYEFKARANAAPPPIHPGLTTFVPTALRGLRDCLQSRRPATNACGPRHIYLRRRSHIRQMRNATAVERLLIALDFVIVEPETLSFAQQAELMRHASTIIAQAGAGLANLIFAPSACDVIILSAWSPQSIYYYFSNMAAIQGQTCTYILGEASGGASGHVAHQDFSVDLEALRTALAETLDRRQVLAQNGALASA